MLSDFKQHELSRKIFSYFFFYIKYDLFYFRMLFCIVNEEWIKEITYSKLLIKLSKILFENPKTKNPFQINRTNTFWKFSSQKSACCWFMNFFAIKESLFKNRLNATWASCLDHSRLFIYRKTPDLRPRINRTFWF